VLGIAAMGIVAGTGGVAAGWVLLHLIAFVIALAYFGVLPAMGTAPTHLPLWTVPVPIFGAIIIGLMARYGSEKIRGHGIPEALEAVILGGSKMGLKVAILKPISSAISIGTGGPLGAEGPIIMTGGAIGSLFAQLFELTDMERKTSLVAGACAGMTAVFGTPVAAMSLAVELLLFELKPRSFLPVAVACITAAIERRYSRLRVGSSSIQSMVLAGWNSALLPVVNPETGKLLGIVSRGDLIKLYWRSFEVETVKQAHFL
jgi:CIC family chloride channel protein